MTCPRPELISQWADGSLSRREAAGVGSHIHSCADCRRQADALRAVGAWVKSVGDTGAACLRAEEMAAVLEGGRVPPHVRTCPRCAAEFQSLRSVERRATRRRQRPVSTAKAWAVAAAVFVVVALLLVLARGKPDPASEIAVRKPARLPDPVEAPVTAPIRPEAPPAPAPARAARPPAASEPPKLPARPSPETPASPTPATEPVQPPAPPAPPGPPEPVLATRVEAPRPSASLHVRAGALFSLAEGKWTKAARIEEGIPLRAEGRTQIDFAQARLTLEAASQFSVSKDEFTLSEGSISGEVFTGSRFALILDTQRIIPDTDSSRVLFCARPDRVVVEEGSARVKDMVLREGLEHLVKKDRIEPQKRRSLPAAARPREALTWRMNLSNENVVRRNIGGGHVQRDPSEIRMLVSDPVAANPYMFGSASYYNGMDEAPLFTVRNNTAIRFHYYLPQPGPLEICLKNGTKEENFNKSLSPVVKQWTTVTLYVKDVPVNVSGKKVTCEVGDRYTGISWFVGRPGVPAEVYIDRFEILEIDR